MGLEFKAVIVVNCEKNTIPLSYVHNELVDEGDREYFVEKERQLLYVACTRAREKLILTFTGQPSPFIPRSALKK